MMEALLKTSKQRKINIMTNQIQKRFSNTPIKSLRVTSLYNSENSFAQYKSAPKMSDFLIHYSLTAPFVRPSTRYFCKKRTKSTGTIKDKIAVAEIEP